MGRKQPGVAISSVVTSVTGALRVLLSRWTVRRPRPIGAVALAAAVATVVALFPHAADATPGVASRPAGHAQTVRAYKAWARRKVGRREFRALNKIWMRESGWNRHARNPSSGAYGIPQALPATKLSSAGADWSWNGYTQMRWGLHYIRARYGSPLRAWHFWHTHHWY